MFRVWVVLALHVFVSLSDEYVSCAQSLGVASGMRGCGRSKSDVHVPKEFPLALEA